MGSLSMVLRDPPVLNLLLHEIVRTLEGVVESERVPKSEPRLHNLTKLLAIALGGRKILRDRDPAIPLAPPQMMTEFYPLLSEMILESMLRDSDDEDDDEEEQEEQEEEEEGQVGELVQQVVQVIGEDGEIREEVWMVPKPVVPKGQLSPAQQHVVTLARLMESSEEICKVALTYALRRLHVGDVRSARPILAAAAAGGVPDTALLDESAVAVTLARRLAAMNSGKDANVAAAPGSPLWRAAVDGLLLRACTAGMEVHEVGF